MVHREQVHTLQLPTKFKMRGEIFSIPTTYKAVASWIVMIAHALLVLMKIRYGSGSQAVLMNLQ